MTDLEALARAWSDKEEGSGPALYDAMEEAGWPWKWKQDTPYWADLFFPGDWNQNEFTATIHLSRLYVEVYAGPLINTKIITEYETPSVEEGKMKVEEQLKQFLREGK